MCCCIRTIMEASHKPRQGDCPRTGASSPSTTSSETSQRSKSTAPTIYSDHRPTSKRNEPVIVNDNHNRNYNQSDEDAVVGPRDSVSTYASTVPSVDEITQEEEEEEEEEEEAPGPRYEVFDRRLEFFPTDALPSNPHTFGDLFPSSRRLRIRHDDATLDGNMNLRVDTVVPHRAGHQQDVTLFHLRMYDLFSRRFSFRRYCRDSGREVFHSERKHSSSSQKKLSRSWSSALASLRPGYSSGQPMRRRDSGSRPTGNDEGVFLDDEDLDSSQDNNDRHPVGFTDTTMLEFSNYAHVEVNRRGAGISKRYDYEYWSTRYQWRRECRREGDLREVSYHLFSTQSSKPIAHLVPDILTPVEAIEEEDKGGWIPPSSMWISDPSVYGKMPDVADAIVATGLIILVDDSIRRRWHSRRPAQLLQPHFREDNNRDIIPSGRIRIIKPGNPDRVFAFYFNVNHDPRANDHVVVDAGGRTAWSSSVKLQGRTFAARYWYDGEYVNNAREDAAEVALFILDPENHQARATTTYPGQLWPQQKTSFQQQRSY